MVIRVAIAFSSRIMAKGVARLLEDDPAIEVVDVLRVGADYPGRVRSLRPDIVLVDFLTLFNSFDETKSIVGTRFILFDTSCGKMNIKAAVLTKNISGVLAVNAEPSYLNKALKEVAAGRLFLDKQTAKDILTTERKAPKSKAAARAISGKGRIPHRVRGVGSGR
jgi:DNA-binding NarL/FixJ family response regulator